MTQDETFLAAMIAAPDDDLPRLVYADYLEEQTGTVDCPHCAYDGCTSWGKTCTRCDGTRRLSNGKAERAELIRVQCELARLEREQTERLNDARDRAKCTHISASWCPNCGDCTCRDRERSMSDPGCPLHDEGSPHAHLEMLKYEMAPLRQRERDLLIDHGHDWADHLFHYVNPPQAAPVGPRAGVATFRRGFVESVTLGGDAWVLHARHILQRHPVREVTFTDWPTLDVHPDPSDSHTRFVLRGVHRVCRVSRLLQAHLRGDAQELAVRQLVKEEWPRLTFHWPAPRSVILSRRVDYTVPTASGETLSLGDYVRPGPEGQWVLASASNAVGVILRPPEEGFVVIRLLEGGW